MNNESLNYDLSKFLEFNDKIYKIYDGQKNSFVYTSLIGFLVNTLGRSKLPENVIEMLFDKAKQQTKEIIQAINEEENKKEI